VAAILFEPIPGQNDVIRKEVPDELEPRPTDRGVEWTDKDGAQHVVPWSAVREFIGPAGISEPSVVTPSIETS
jgi:hypothetical protein